MKGLRGITLFTIALVVVAIFTAVVLAYQYSYWGQAPTFCGMGGMMGHGAMDGMMGYYPRVPNPISQDEAKAIARNYLRSLNNPDLSVGEFEEYSNNFYVSLFEKSSGRGAFEILIDRSLGTIWPEPQSMMWNAKYRLMGMMGNYTSGDVQVKEPVTKEQAMKIAQDFLRAAFPGTETGETIHYYGYYTIMVTLNDEHYGMLSINAYTGAIWYHVWHGMFISELRE